MEQLHDFDLQVDEEADQLLHFLIVSFGKTYIMFQTENSFPRRRSPITESTREVLLLFDWCFCAWLPPSLYLRDPRASLGDCEDRSRSRPLRRKWSGASPRPPSGGSPLAGTPPLYHRYQPVGRGQHTNYLTYILPLPLPIYLACFWIYLAILYICLALT